MSSRPTNIVIAPDGAVYENTPCLQKVEAAVVQQGTATTIQWELRDRDGYPIDLGGIFFVDGLEPFDTTQRSNCDAIWNILHELNPDYYAGQDCHPPVETYFMEVRIQPADEPLTPMWIVPAAVCEPKRGLLKFDVPNKVADFGGIYVLNIGICRSSDRRPLYIHRGLLCVERSAWRDPNVDCKMPTLMDVRMRIMDTDTENLLQGYVEFTTADILDSIVSAVREWNGTTPYLSGHVYTCYTFPWIEPWLNKIVASLYQKAAMRFTRNKLQVNHGGVQGDDLDRDKEYQALAQQFDKMWKEWMLTKKKEINLQAFSGTVRSPYGRMVNSTRGRLPG